MSATDDTGNYTLDLIDHSGLKLGEEVELTVIGPDVELIFPCGENHRFHAKSLLDFVAQAGRAAEVAPTAYLRMDELGLEYHFLRVEGPINDSHVAVYEYTDYMARFEYRQVMAVLGMALRVVEEGVA